MTFEQAITEHVQAGFAGLWIRSDEHDDCERTLSRLAHQHGWTLAHWDCDRGTTVPAKNAGIDCPDPLAAIRSINGLREETDPQNTRALMTFRNLHRFLHDPLIVQALITAIERGKAIGNHYLILAPTIEIPTEWQRLMVVIEHDLPGRAALQEILESVTDNPEEIPNDLEPVLDAAAGLTRLEAENAYALAIVREGRISPTAIWETKTQTLKRSGLMELYRGSERFADLGGLAFLKDFSLRALDRSRPDRRATPRGIMLLGVPGTGKSAFAKALGNETGRPTIALNLGSLMGSLVGETEANTRRALSIIDAMSPCVLFIDEVEKGLAGTTGAGSQDSGVGSRMLGSLLSWLNDHTSDVFTVCTSNDISALPPEFTRAERFDGIFFLDFPGRAEREAIWSLYLSRYGLDPESPRPDSENWTGAEIRSCCRLADLLGVTPADAARSVVPISSTAGERVAALRRWASGRALDAQRPGLYRDREPAPTPDSNTPRRIERKTALA